MPAEEPGAQSENEAELETREEAEKLEFAHQRVLAAFAAHWGRILQSDNDVASERAYGFLAGSASARERLSRSFYSREHARRMASLSPREIDETLQPWLGHALRYWLLDELGEFEGRGGTFLDELPTGEYVTIVCHHHRDGEASVDRYPGAHAYYDDLYERLLAGCSCGGVLRVYKSTGEVITPSEARSMRAGIKRELLSVIASEGSDYEWQFNMEAQDRWEIGDFEGEDSERVVVVEVNDLDQIPTKR
jgi:hypothetical protein